MFKNFKRSILSVVIGMIIFYIFISIWINPNLFSVKQKFNDFSLLGIKNTELNNIINNYPKIFNISYLSCSGGTCIIPKASGLPSDENMVCLWSYNSGNGNVPYLEETKGWLPTINIPDQIWNLSTLCRDINGNIYFGKEQK
jgi:hypothetical protein